ncbi:hypothetical protein [Nocardiopsis sp. CNT312]|uniref:hypothetical protein n=1 Tax=Nocardiopsis sp. CNT312 TaxID=1137268 RepID=UPI00048CF62B|nr:hypothetical protein [Nocardiopsis sp. CNT312]
MKRFSTVSGLVLATGLALGALSAPASADNNSDVQNITVPICADVLQFAGISADGCNVVDKKSDVTAFVD